MTLVLFDFDGTLTRRDTLFSFLRFHVGTFRFVLGMVWLLPVLIGHQLRLVNAERAKLKLLSFFLKGQWRVDLNESGRKFCKEVLPTILREDILAKLRTYHKEGATIALVSASCDVWLAPFCVAEKITCLCTELEYNEAGFFTGNFRTPNCNGKEKENRIRKAFPIDQFKKVIAYGDSSGDEFMLALAHEKHFLG